MEAAMTRLRTLILLVVVALTGAFLVAGTAAAEVCPTGWGSLPKTVAALGTAPVSGIRTGIHPCFDTFVIDVNGPASGYDVRYVDTVFSEAQGLPLYVPGGARLAVVAHHPAGPLPYLVNQRAADVSGYPVLRSITYGGSFEGYTLYGVGVRARLPFEVAALQNPGRLVINVARTW